VTDDVATPGPSTPDDRTRARRRAELLAQIAELRALRDRLAPQRARLARGRAALRRTLGRL
jgi:hypothetical protein